MPCDLDAQNACYNVSTQLVVLQPPPSAAPPALLRVRAGDSQHRGWASEHAEDAEIEVIKSIGERFDSAQLN